MFISACAILCGADDWNAIKLFAKTKERWFRQHLTLPGGILGENHESPCNSWSAAPFMALGSRTIK